MKDISYISFSDPSTCWEDKDARSIAYFSLNDVTRIDVKLFDELKNIAFEKNKNVRICMHHEPSDLLHDSVIIECRDSYYPPKKYINKSQSFHIIDGSVAMFIFNDNGEVIDCCVLDGKNCFVYRVEKNVYHTAIALTDYVIYHETTSGPYIGHDDRSFPSWGPQDINAPNYLEFKNNLLKSYDLL